MGGRRLAISRQRRLDIFGHRRDDSLLGGDARGDKRGRRRRDRADRTIRECSRVVAQHGHRPGTPPGERRARSPHVRGPGPPDSLRHGGTTSGGMRAADRVPVFWPSHGSAGRNRFARSGRRAHAALANRRRSAAQPHGASAPAESGWRSHAHGGGGTGGAWLRDLSARDAGFGAGARRDDGDRLQHHAYVVRLKLAT